MKFFHLSDLHLGLKLYQKDLMDDQRYVLEQIIHRTQEIQPDAVLIAGDIYDKAIPSAEAVELFDWFMNQLSDAVPNAELMLISGNHDSAPRLNLYRGILTHHRIHVVGLPPQSAGEAIEKVSMQDEFGAVNFYLLPFVKPSMVTQVVGKDENGNNLSYEASICRLIEREDIDLTQRNVLVSHQFYLPVGQNADSVERMDNEICSVGNVDSVRADILNPFDYAALGHIHKPWKLDEVYRYCGTPLACSVSEVGQKKGIVLVELNEKGNISTSIFPLTPLRQIRKLKGALDEILRQACEDYVVLTVTDLKNTNVIEARERLAAAFPNLLEFMPENTHGADYSITYTEDAERDPFTLCTDFLKDLMDEEKEILRQVINAAQEVNWD